MLDILSISIDPILVVHPSGSLSLDLTLGVPTLLLKLVLLLPVSHLLFLTAGVHCVERDCYRKTNPS